MFYEEFMLKPPEPFAESREIIFDIDDGFLKQKLQDGTYQKLFHWQTAEDMLDDDVVLNPRFDYLLYNHPDEFVDMVHNGTLNDYFKN